MDLSDLDHWDFHLPEDRIARRPAATRTGSRLLHLPLDGGPFGHRQFTELPELLEPGDLLVGNDTRVMAARLEARRESGAKVELLVLEPGPGVVRALGRNIRRVKPGDRLLLAGGGEARVHAVDGGEVAVSFDAPVAEVLERQGAMPLPPYLQREADEADAERYQTVYAGPLGAAAAPTAGLHFDENMLAQLADRRVGFATVTLHVGLGTFKPLQEEQLQEKRLHEERFSIPEATARAIADTRARGHRVIAIGTTTTRALEASTPAGATSPEPGPGATQLFLAPPDRVTAIDGLITNFHLPRSSLLMLVACLCSRERLLSAYGEAITSGYRFYSYGDAMLLL
ncbi:MAG: tRNA preQ1(34) S-adenosylmethionine ribosyltransferase-isomerase QueA [Deltaproteobacteria bacterium]|nr:MAG: tRNA preQ1(34) S-adenosylmethionine ribosyltransferase-isomerase QueA [Deltaproteobacteria bacterium]